MVRAPKRYLSTIAMARHWHGGDWIHGERAPPLTCALRRWFGMQARTNMAANN